MSMLAHWLRPQCSRAPETGGSSMSVRPLWNQGVPSVQTTTTGLAVKVTPSPCPCPCPLKSESESVGVGGPEAQPTLGVGVRL